MSVASALFESSYGARDRDGVRGRVGLTPSFTAIQSPPASWLSTRPLATFYCRLTRLFFRTLVSTWRPASAGRVKVRLPFDFAQGTPSNAEG